MKGPVLAPHLHLDKLRYLKVAAQLSYGALCPSDDEFHLSGPGTLSWFWLAGVPFVPPASPCHLDGCLSIRGAPLPAGQLRSPHCSARGAPEVHSHGQHVQGKFPC